MIPTRIPSAVRHLRVRRRNIDNESGQATVELLMWAAATVVVIVAITALLQALGADVVGYIREQLGI